MRKLGSGFLELADEPPVVLRPVDGGDAEDGAADAALIIIVVCFAAEPEVEALERSSLKDQKKKSFRYS